MNTNSAGTFFSSLRKFAVGVEKDSHTMRAQVAKIPVIGMALLLVCISLGCSSSK